MAMFNHTLDIPYGYCQCGCGQKTKTAKRSYPRSNTQKGEHFNCVRGHSVNRMPDNVRLWSRVALTSDPEKCWEWQGKIINSGYGSLSVNNKNQLAHRLAWRVSFGEIPNGLEVLHKCDNRICCNPTHLFLGTDLDNAKDKVSKGRHRPGEEHGNHKLTANQVKYIRRRYKEGGISQHQLAKEIGISPSTIWMVVNNKRWKE